MGFFSIALGIVTGICLGTGIFYTFVGLRRRGQDAVHLSYAAFALSYGCAVLTALLAYNATALEQFLHFDHWSSRDLMRHHHRNAAQ